MELTYARRLGTSSFFENHLRAMPKTRKTGFKIVTVFELGKQFAMTLNYLAESLTGILRSICLV